MEAGQTVPFVLTHARRICRRPRRSTPTSAGARPTRSGRSWIGRGACTRIIAGAVLALAADAEGAHLSPDRRHRRRADHVAARAARRRAQLGLPLLLAARRDLHAAGADERRLPRGSSGLARTGCCARVAGSPTQVQIMYGVGRRAPAAGVGSAAGSPATRARSRCASATPPSSSCSSTSTAK